LGLIADIHADYDALVTVLDRLRNVHQVNQVLCAGDLTGYGKQPEEVIALIRHEAIPTVRGNHDSPASGISAENGDYLRSLPAEWRTIWGEYQIYMCHGIPGVNFVGFTPTLLEKDQVQAMVAALNADIVISGHTHQVLCQKLGRTWLLNPGSVYAKTGEGTSHTYGVLDLRQRLFSIFDLLQPVAVELLTVFSLD
jgi:putative phosphoesterase